MERLYEENITGAVLKHMIHSEDLIYLGKKGCDFLVESFYGVYNALKGETSNNTRVTTKWDGCVDGNSILKTNKGFIPIKEIKNFKDPLKVESFDIESGKDIMSEVKGYNEQEGQKNWVEITFDNGTTLRCTEDHPVYTTNRGYVPAIELNNNDIIKD